jgi:hypothetical protein
MKAQYPLAPPQHHINTPTRYSKDCKAVRMPVDQSGQLQAGSIGLFDCDHEYDAIQQRLRAERGRQEKKARKSERQRDKQLSVSSSSRRYFTWLHRLFSHKKSPPDQRGPSRKVRTPILAARASSTAIHPHKLPNTPERTRATRQYDEEMYNAEDVHPDASPFFTELGLVRMRSDKPGDGGWTVVPESAVHRQ